MWTPWRGAEYPIYNYKHGVCVSVCLSVRLLLIFSFTSHVLGTVRTIRAAICVCCSSNIFEKHILALMRERATARIPDEQREREREQRGFSNPALNPALMRKRKRKKAAARIPDEHR